MLKNNKPLCQLLILFGVLEVLGVIGCSAKTGCTGERTQCFAASTGFLKNNTQNPALTQNFNYMRVSMNGQVVWLAQGATDQWPAADTKVYYSADRSVFKWANGRLISVTTPEYNWREHTRKPINWAAVKPFKFIRDIDTVEGLTAKKEQRQLTSSVIPNHDSYVGDKTPLLWMHETGIATSAAMRDSPSYDNWYAFKINDLSEPVYGQHCLSKNYCLAWQVWTKS